MVSIKSSFLKFWSHRAAWGILVPWPGTEPVAKAVEVPSPNHWTAREFPDFSMLSYSLLVYPRLRQNSLVGMAKGMRWLSYWTLQSPKAPQKGYPFFWWCQPSPVSIVTLLRVSVCAHLVFALVWLPCAGSSPHPPAQSFPLVVKILSSVKHRNFMCSRSEYKTQPLIQSLLFPITWKQWVTAVVLKVCVP